MATRLTLLCHASSEAQRAARFPGDEPIEESAERKTAALAGRIRQTERCWTSPALRARQTAAILNLTPMVEPALRDCDYGRWAGRTLAEVAAAEPEATAAWIADPAAAPHGGESLLDLLHRVAAWLDGQAAGRGRVLAVTHAAVIRAAILHAIAAPPASFWRIDIAPLSRTDLSAGDGRWKLNSANCEVSSEVRD